MRVGPSLEQDHHATGGGCQEPMTPGPPLGRFRPRQVGPGAPDLDPRSRVRARDRGRLDRRQDLEPGLQPRPASHAVRGRVLARFGDAPFHWTRRRPNGSARNHGGHACSHNPLKQLFFVPATRFSTRTDVAKTATFLAAFWRRVWPQTAMSWPRIGRILATFQATSWPQSRSRSESAKASWSGRVSAPRPFIQSI